jgi:ribonuclease HII
MAKILGIDESGRGPVCGPLVLCGYLIDDSKRENLRKIGVRDSKLLTAKKRSSMYSHLRKLADGARTVIISACEIDKLRTEINLNKIEIGKMQFLINKMKPDCAIIDAPEVNTKAFAAKIQKGLKCECEIIAENFADKNHLEVGAASIIAKVTRDNEIKKLHTRHGNFGSGYPSDPVTVAFLKNWLKKNKEFPGFVRKSWITAQLMKAEAQQTNIRNFLD